MPKNPYFEAEEVYRTLGVGYNATRQEVERASMGSRSAEERQRRQQAAHRLRAPERRIQVDVLLLTQRTGNAAASLGSHPDPAEVLPDLLPPLEAPSGWEMLVLPDLGLLPDGPPGDASNAPVGDASNAPVGDASNAPVGDASNAPAGDASNAPVGDASNAPVGDAPELELRQAYGLHEMPPWGMTYGS